MSRSLVPSLALIAIAGVASAADQWVKPEFSFGGFVDAWAQVGQDHIDNDSNSSTNSGGTFTRFHGFGAAHSDVRFTEQTGGRIDVWLAPRSQDFSTSTRVYVRDANVFWGDDTWTVTVGKQIRPLGWVRPDPASWYRVLPSTIGYTGREPTPLWDSVYGNDVLGGSVAWHGKDVPMRVTGMLNNGFFSPGDANNDDVNNRRQRDALGYGLDAAFVPNKTVTVGFQAAFDPRSDGFTQYNIGLHNGSNTYSNRGTFSRTAPGGVDSGGDALLLSLNTTVKPLHPLTVGAEISRFTIGKSIDINNNKIADTDYHRWQELVMANWAFEQSRFPLSVTGEIQHIDARNGDSERGRAWEYTAAVLTQPIARFPLHLDAELSYASADSDQTTKANGWEIAGRALLIF